jgi:hypothetical protein
MPHMGDEFLRHSFSPGAGLNVERGIHVKGAIGHQPDAPDRNILHTGRKRETVRLCSQSQRADGFSAKSLDRAPFIWQSIIQDAPAWFKDGF